MWNLPNYGGGSTPDAGTLQKVLDILGSKGGQTLVNAAGAGMSAYGQGKQAEADRAQSAGQFNANIAQRQLEASQQDQRARATAAADAAPLGANQQFAGRNAMLAAILPGLKNISFNPGNPEISAAMGNSTGGFRLPEAGFDPKMVDQFFGPAATQASIAERAKAISQINPRAALPPIQDLFGGPEDGSENPFLTDVRTFQQSELDRQLAESREQRELIRRAIENDITGERAKKGKGIGGRLAGAGMGAATGFATGGPLGALFGGIAGLF